MPRWSQLSVVVLLTLCPLLTRGQQFRGAITGRIVDAQQAAVPGVKITATDAETQARYSMGKPLVRPVRLEEV